MSKTNNSHQKSNYRKSRKQGKGNSKPISRSQQYKEDSQAPSRNDVEWYTSSPNLLVDAASLPYNQFTGTVTLRGDISGDTISNYSVPGAINVSVVPGPGYAKDSTDPINVAAHAIYSYVRHQNSGHANYDAPDLMLYLLAMDSAFTYLTWLQRLLGTIHMYSAVNRYTPRDLIELQGVDFDDLNANIAQFRYSLNAAITRMGAFCVPNNMPIFKRHASLFGNYYIEGESMREQLYLYSPKGYYLFEIPTEGGAGQLTFKPLQPSGSTEKLKVADLIAHFTTMIDAIAYDEDMNIMSGDILKAYGTDSLLKLALIPEMFVCVPQRNTEVLEQFQNVFMVPDFTYTSCNITQVLTDTQGRLRWEPSVTILDDPIVDEVTASVISRSRLLNTSNVNPTPAMNMVNTRMMPAVVISRAPGTETVDGISIYAGSEIPVDMSVIYYRQNGISAGQKVKVTLKARSYDIWQDDDDAYAESLADSIKLSAALSSFKYAPCYEVAHFNSVSGEFNMFMPYMQLDTYTTVDMATLKRLHEAALLGEWNVDRLAISK